MSSIFGNRRTTKVTSPAKKQIDAATMIYNLLPAMLGKLTLTFELGSSLFKSRTKKKQRQFTVKAKSLEFNVMTVLMGKIPLINFSCNFAIDFMFTWLFNFAKDFLTN